MFGAEGKVVFNHIGEIVQKVDAHAIELVDEMAERIKRGGESRARRDTSEMADSFEIRVAGIYLREVVNTSDHFIYNEYGTSNMTAQPMLTPASTDEQLGMEAAAKRAFEEVL